MSASQPLVFLLIWYNIGRTKDIPRRKQRRKTYVVNQRGEKEGLEADRDVLLAGFSSAYFIGHSRPI